MSQQAQLQCTSPLTPSANIGRSIKQGGAISAGTPTPVPFTKLMVSGTAGAIHVQNGDIDYVIPYWAKENGVLEAVGNLVIASGTTATGIYWYTSD